MSRISWDEAGSHVFEAGVDRGVFYSSNGAGVPWNGLVAAVESVEDYEVRVFHIDGQKYMARMSLGTFTVDIGAITYPPEFEPYDGYDVPIFTGQSRDSFGLSYRTLVGNDVDGVVLGYKIHIIFNCIANPTTRLYPSLNNDTDISLFSWHVSTTPVPIPDAKPSSHFILDTTHAPQILIDAVEDLIYGTETTNATFPTVDQLIELVDASYVFKVTDHGDGTATIDGPDYAVFFVEFDLAEITYESVVELDSETYQLSSL